MIGSGNDTPETWAVYADWLEEQGDPRGALMRLSPSSSAHGDLVAQYWGRWFGTIPREAFTRLEWENGFVSRVTVRSPAAVSLFTLPVMHFARELSISLPFDAPLNGLDALPRLRHLRVSLRWGHSLGELRPAFEKLASIELEMLGSPGSGELGVLTWPLPALRHFVLDALRLPQQTLGWLAAAPWLSQLESLGLCDIDHDNARPLLDRSEPFAALGAALHLDLANEGGRRGELRMKFPLATMRQGKPMVRVPFRERGPWPIPQPRDAPANFRTYPPQLTPFRADVFVSSGDRMTDPLNDLPEARSCAWCASNSTLVIYAQLDGHTPHGRARWIREWRCEECDGITTSRRPDASC